MLWILGKRSSTKSYFGEQITPSDYRKRIYETAEFFTTYARCNQTLFSKCVHRSKSRQVLTILKPMNGDGRLETVCSCLRRQGCLLHLLLSDIKQDVKPKLVPSGRSVWIAQMSLQWIQRKILLKCRTLWCYVTSFHVQEMNGASKRLEYLQKSPNMQRRSVVFLVLEWG